MKRKNNLRAVTRGGVISASVVIATFALYVLSSGPATYLSERGFISYQAMADIYTPLIPLDDWHSFHWYLSWWRQKALQ
jgi:hypothetical protein